MNSLLSCLRTHLWSSPSCTRNVVMTEVDACRRVPLLRRRPPNKTNTARRSLSRTGAFEKHRELTALAHGAVRHSRLLIDARTDSRTLHRHAGQGARQNRSVLHHYPQRHSRSAAGVPHAGKRRHANFRNGGDCIVCFATSPHPQPASVTRKCAWEEGSGEVAQLSIGL